MSPNRRIFLNIIATYGRSLYALALGIFTARWALLSLGEVDYGLFGLVGGLTAFVAFFNNLFANAVGRFYAFYIGAARKDPISGLDDCRRWFNTALFIHVVLPTIVIIIGYPVGEWAVRHFLTIPIDRIEACVWVWRFSCITCFVSMFNVPFQAMYTAKQEIAELTVYSVVGATANALVLYYMITHPSDWLQRYALATCLIAVIPQLFICIRAVKCFPECKFIVSYLYDAKRLKEISIYAVSRLWTAISIMCDSQAQAILTNKYLGPSANASMTIGNTVAAHTQTLSASLSGAFWPAVFNLAGEGKSEAMRTMSYRACKLSSILFLIFAIPLALEIGEVMRLWLKEPPMFVCEFCVCILIVNLLDKLTEGYWMSIFAAGRVARYSFTVGWTGISGAFISWGLFLCGWGIIGVGIARIIAKVLTVFVRMYYGWHLVGLSAVRWLKNVVSPVMLAVLVSSLVGALPQLFMEASFTRIVVTTIGVEIVFLPLLWFFAFSLDERMYLQSKLAIMVNKFRGGRI